MIDKSQDMFILDSSNIAKLAKLDEQVIKITDYYTHEIVAPNSWAKALFSEICKIIGGSQPPKEYFTNEPREGYIRLIQIRDYKTDKFATYIPTELAKRFCKKEDIMIGRYGPPIFQILRGLEGAYNVALMKAEPNTNLFDKEFLYYFLQTPNLFNYVASASLRTAGQDGVRKELLDNYPVFVPPLNEQRRIVAKIEALKARSQRVKEELEAIPALLDQFRQSVLAAAFRGDLTADWREKNPDVEPASVLLERIRAERRRRWEEAELEKMKAQGKTPKDDKWKEKYKEPVTPEISDLPKLPKEWVWASLQMIADVIDPNPSHRMPKYVESGIPFISTENFSSADSLDFSVGKQVSQETLAKQRRIFKIEEGDFALSRIGTIGQTRFLPPNKDYCLSHALVVIKTYSDSINKRFLRNLISSDFVLSQAKQGIQSVGVPDLGMSKIRSFCIPLPPLHEQHKILEEIERSLLVINKVKQVVDQSLIQADILDRSLLAKAFRGELVPQDPNDEPASVLLERIRAEREKLDTKKKAKGKTEKKSRKAKPEAAEPEQLSLPGFE